MTSRPADVTAELELRLIVPGSPSVPVPSAVRYDASDPYAVHVRFRTGVDGGMVDWTFARDLLTDGVSRPAGDGDVKVWPVNSKARPTVCISLCSPSGTALFEACQHELVDFLTRTYAAVPTGAEADFVDVDAELDLLLRAEPGA